MGKTFRSPFEPTPYSAHPTSERHRYELRDATTGKVRSTSVPVEHLKVIPDPVFEPALTEDDQMRLWEVEKILDHRRRKVDGVTRNEYFIRWAGFGAESDSNTLKVYLTRLTPFRRTPCGAVKTLGSRFLPSPMVH